MGIHSYLTYLRDRLLLAKELLHESGSVFVQISDENLHLVRSLLDEVFGSQNFSALIVYSTTGGFSSAGLSRTGDYVRSEEHTSELQSLMRISYAVFCLKKKKKTQR